MHPLVTVTARAAQRLRRGHPWAYRGEVTSAPPAAADVVLVADDRRRPFATALWSAASPIALRVVAPGAVVVDGELLRARLATALARRRALFPLDDAYRLVHAEADGLPGLIVDRYGDALVVQTSAAALDRREPEVAELLAELCGPRLVVARDDGATRDFEGLPRRKGVLLGGDRADPRATYHEGDVALEIDLLEDAKTGGFLDQRENHLHARAYAPGARRALDAFSYHGGFSLQLARAGCALVEGVDESAAAVERARANARRNGLEGARFVVGDAFDALRRAEAAGDRYDVVVVDPPALAKRRAAKDALDRAARQYRELNLRALRLVAEGGVLITCSCSGRMTAARFGEALEAAAADLGRPVQVLERRGAGRDHPGLLGVPETEYLKCWVLRVL